MGDLKQKLESVTNELIEIQRKLADLESQIEEKEATLTLIIATLKDVYVKFDQQGNIEDIAYQQKDPTYIYIKVTNESIRQAIKSFLKKQYPIFEEYESAKTDYKIASVKYDSLKQLIKLITSASKEG